MTFTTFLAVQLRRTMETANSPAYERGLWGNTLMRLKAEGYDESTIAAGLAAVHVEPVLTAHPTEAKRTSVIVKHRAIYLLLVKKENPILTPTERQQNRDEIKELLELLWRTGNIYLEKPELRSERRNVIHYLKNVFPETLPILDNRLKAAWLNQGFSPDTLRRSQFPKLGIGTWVGGDRDGHGLVTAGGHRRIFAGFTPQCPGRHPASAGRSGCQGESVRRRPQHPNLWRPASCCGTCHPAVLR